MRAHYDFSKMKGRKNPYLKGTSKNSDFFVSARSRSAAETTAEGWPEGRGRSPSNHRAENRSVHGVHEDSSTELTPQSRKKCIFRGALKYLKQPVTMRLDVDSVDYFKSLAEESGIPYQTLINLYLRDCAAKERKLNMKWR